MQELYVRSDFPSAALAGQWAVQKGADGRYDLACCLALSGRNEAAFFYLQEAAHREGVDADHARGDADLAQLRSDPRWKVVSEYLDRMGLYWSQQKVLRTTLILPRKHKVGQPIGVVVGLHGLGGNETFVDRELQGFSDRLGLALVGVSGSVALGPKAFRWSEDGERDQAHLQQALQSLEPRLRVNKGRVVLFGFSQGAQVAFQLSAAHPDRYRGALVFSPGGYKAFVPPPLESTGQRYVFTAGGGEHPDTVARTRAQADWARRTGSQVKLKIYPGITSHSYPPDFALQFVPWIGWLLE
jgi:predicted esterase